jgi:hypothetical protein
MRADGFLPSMSMSMSVSVGIPTSNTIYIVTIYGKCHPQGPKRICERT